MRTRWIRPGEAGIAAAVDEDAAVGQVGQQSSPVGDADRGVQRDGLPDTVNLGCGDTVLGQHCGRQVGALDLKASLSRGETAQPEVVHDAGGEEQVLVVGGIVQAAFVPGEQAGVKEGTDAMARDRRARRGLHDGQARGGQRPRRQGGYVVHTLTVRIQPIPHQWPAGH